MNEKGTSQKGRREEEEGPTDLLQEFVVLSLLGRIELWNAELDSSVGCDGEDAMILERGCFGSVENEIGRHGGGGWEERERGESDGRDCLSRRRTKGRKKKI